MAAIYVLAVRQASALPAASFRFHLAVDTLAVQLTVLLIKPVEDFHLQVFAPCRAHEKKAATQAAFGKGYKKNYFTALMETSGPLYLE